MKRSTSWLVCSVVAAHGLAICLVLLIQGCGTPISPETGVATSTTKVRTPASSNNLPPRSTSQRPVVQPRPKPRPYVAPMQDVVTSSEGYTVQKGDSLSRIASRYNVTVTELLALNQITKPDHIRVGQRLMLPGHVDVSAHKPVVKPIANTAPKVAVSGDKYVVKPGDTLSQIALDHGVKVADIRAANSIAKDVIFVGQALVVPGATKKPSASPVVAKPKPAAKTEVTAPTSAAPVTVEPKVDVEATPPVVETDSADSGSGSLSTEGIPLTMHTHEVKDGEDLYSVSLIWDISIDELKRINGLSGTDLTPGKVLRIPRAE